MTLPLADIMEARRTIFGYAVRTLVRSHIFPPDEWSLCSKLEEIRPIGAPKLHGRSTPSSTCGARRRNVAARSAIWLRPSHRNEALCDVNVAASVCGHMSSERVHHSSSREAAAGPELSRLVEQFCFLSVSEKERKPLCRGGRSSAPLAPRAPAACKLAGPQRQTSLQTAIAAQMERRGRL